MCTQSLTLHITFDNIKNTEKYTCIMYYKFYFNKLGNHMESLLDHCHSSHHTYSIPCIRACLQI